MGRRYNILKILLMSVVISFNVEHLEVEVKILLS